MSTGADTWGIAANYDGDAVVRPGARCWLGWNQGGDRRIVWVRSRGGRWIEKVVAAWRLSDHRAKWLPPCPRPYRVEMAFATAAEAAELAAKLDKAARDERARRNMRDIERMAGLMDEHGRRNDGRLLADD